MRHTAKRIMNFFAGKGAIPPLPSFPEKKNPMEITPNQH
jgi:hypothetical protein